MSVVHVYGQGGWHDPAYVVGDREGLLALRAAIDEALAGKPGKAQVFVIDGEGYPIHVVEASEEKLEKLQLPYGDFETVEYDERDMPIQQHPMTLVDE